LIEEEKERRRKRWTGDEQSLSAEPGWVTKSKQRRMECVDMFLTHWAAGMQLSPPG
jgi:hypothetical protein